MKLSHILAAKNIYFPCRCFTNKSGLKPQKLGVVAYTCNPSHLGDGDWDSGLRPAHVKS
jgi:hypothetical protein